METASSKPPIQIDKFEDDALNLQPFANRLEEFMLIERNFVEGALVLSLGAPFGAGKSTFLKMWRNDLESRRQSDPSLPHPVMLNAWESDFCGDPFLAVISELVAVVERIEGEGTDSSDRFREAAKEAAWFSVGLANSFVSAVSGLDPVAAGQFAEERTAKKPDILAAYRDRMDSLQHIRAELTRHFGPGTAGAMIMVDELDRCRPEYAIGYLETIKHVFGIKGLMFVLAVDSQRLAASAESVFGRLNFDEFYRKFVHRSASLPTPSEDGRHDLLIRYLDRFIEHDGIRVSFAKIERHHIEQIAQLMHSLRMTPRQAQEVFRICGHLFHGTLENRKRLYWGLTSATLLLAIVRVGDSEMFERLKGNAASLEDTGRYLVRLLGPKRAVWWFSLMLTGWNQIPSDEELADLYKRVGILDGDFRAAGALGQFSQGWGHREGRVPEIITMIDELGRFR